MDEERMKRRLQTNVAITCIKIFLVIYNIIFWLTGVGILAIGVLLKVYEDHYAHLTKDYSSVAPYVFIVSGVVIIIVSISACCCTVKSKPVLLYMLSTFLFFIFVVELGLAISAYMFRQKIQNQFKDNMKNMLKDYRGSKKGIDMDLDLLQSTIHCCGVDNYTDWFESSWAGGEKAVPKSCCKNVQECTNKPLINVDQIYQNGCSNIIIGVTKKYANVILGVSGGFALFQLLGTLMSFTLGKIISKNQYELLT
ncbi:tetraspanin-6-like [Limulus polyphemus]|uniref:Tetraspanin n=1 Tax=Limulus polyphemus TaxID=6850 RepID=A0ABM1BHC8_LIMPO|nr:tetraspanin-6-like [Limulus polyphemus]